MAYSPHKYWSPVNSVADIQYGRDLRIRQRAIWFGETGENSNAWHTGLIKIMESEGVGWAWWPLKKVETINAPLSITKNLGYQQLLNYWSGNASAPSIADAAVALMQLATNLKAENCTYNRGVIDAMFRQIKRFYCIAMEGAHYSKCCSCFRIRYGSFRSSLLRY